MSNSLADLIASLQQRAAGRTGIGGPTGKGGAVRCLDSEAVEHLTRLYTLENGAPPPGDPTLG